MTRIAVISAPEELRARNISYATTYYNPYENKMIGSFWTDPWNDIDKVATKVWHNSIDALKQAGKWTQKQFDEAYNEVKDWTHKQWNNLKEWTNDKIALFRKWVLDKYQYVIDKIVKPAWRFILKIFPLTLIARNSFLLVVKNNVFNWGRKMGVAMDTNKDRVALWWTNLGGDPDALFEAINFGRKQKMIGEPISIATIVTLAVAVIGAAVSLINAIKGKGNNEGGKQPSNAENDILNTYANGLKANLNSGGNQPPPAGGTPTNQNTNTGGLALLGVGIALLKAL